MNSQANFSAYFACGLILMMSMVEDGVDVKLDLMVGWVKLQIS